LSTCPASMWSHRLSLSSRCALCHPLILLLCWLVVVSPLDMPPSCRLVISSSLCATFHCLDALAGCRTIISCHPLIAPSSRPLIVLAGCCVASPCAAISSSPSPKPSNAVKRCCRHQTPLPPPPLYAVSIVHRCHSCCPLPPSNSNTHICTSPPSNADACRRHPPLLMSISIAALSLPIRSPHHRRHVALSPFVVWQSL
jgi:hypothetical protein